MNWSVVAIALIFSVSLNGPARAEKIAADKTHDSDNFKIERPGNSLVVISNFNFTGAVTPSGMNDDRSQLSDKIQVLIGQVILAVIRTNECLIIELPGGKHTIQFRGINLREDPITSGSKEMDFAAGSINYIELDYMGQMFFLKKSKREASDYTSLPRLSKKYVGFVDGKYTLFENAAQIGTPVTASSEKTLFSHPSIQTDPAKAVRANRYGVAVIIGNKNYSQHNQDVPDVKFAHNDAAAMFQYVKDVLGYREGNIIYLKDASQAEMMSVFGNSVSPKGKLYNWVRPEKGEVFVYYSGHGAPGLSNGTGYLLPVNADPMTVELNGYSLETFYKNLAQIPAKKMTVVLDACFSGSSASGTVVQNASSIALRRIEPKAIMNNASIFSAAGLSEVASWDQEREMGLFTRFFLDGVNGIADGEGFGNGDGEVTLGELKGYLEEEVRYFARRNYYREQNPQVTGNGTEVMATLP